MSECIRTDLEYVERALDKSTIVAPRSRVRDVKLFFCPPRRSDRNSSGTIHRIMEANRLAVGEPLWGRPITRVYIHRAHVERFIFGNYPCRLLYRKRFHFKPYTVFMANFVLLRIGDNSGHFYGNRFRRILVLPVAGSVKLI